MTVDLWNWERSLLEKKLDKKFLKVLKKFNKKLGKIIKKQNKIRQEIREREEKLDKVFPDWRSYAKHM